MAPPQHAPSSWADLPMDLAGVVLRRLPRHADRVRFAAVCRQWRASAHQSPLPQHYPWLALPDRTFYSLPGSAFRPLPLHLDGHRQLPHAQSSCGEWLAFERHDGACTLVSPFSKSTTIQLPGLSESNEPLRVAHDVPVPSFLKLVVCSSDLVAAIVDDDGWTCSKLALCRPGASMWSVSAHDQLRHLQDIVYFQGELYALDRYDGLFSVSVGRDGRTGEPTVSGVEHLMDIPSGLLKDSPRYLLESNGALLLVYRENPNMAKEAMAERYSGGGGRGWWSAPLMGLELEMATRFEVFEADMARSRWAKLGSVGDDRVLFVGPWCSRAVRVSEQQCKDCIYTGGRIFFLEDAGPGRHDGRRCYYRKREPFYCSIYDMRTRRSELFLDTSVRPLKGFPVTWLFTPSQGFPWY